MIDKVPGSLAAAPTPMITRPGNEPVHVAGQSGHDGTAAEDGHADEHDALAAEDVAQHPRHQHEAGERQCITVDHPLQRGDSRVQVALDVGQPDADDGVVEEGEKEDAAQGGERQSLGGRTEPSLLDGESRGSTLDCVGSLSLLASAGPVLLAAIRSRATDRRGAFPRVLRTQAAGSGTIDGVPRGQGGPTAALPGEAPRTHSCARWKARRTGGGFRCCTRISLPVTEGTDDLAAFFDLIDYPYFVVTVQIA